jgi:hypothetical protein
MSDSRRGFGFYIGSIDHFTTQLVNTLNYSVIINSPTLEITSAQAKSFSVRSVFSTIYLVTASNNGYSSASGIKPSLNGGSLPTELSLRLPLLYIVNPVAAGANLFATAA